MGKIPKVINGITICEYLKNEYWVKERTTVDMANDFNVHRVSLTRIMDNCGIKRRTISEDNARRYANMSIEEIKRQTMKANDKARNDPSFMSSRKGRHPWEGFSDEKIIAIKEKISKSKLGNDNPTRTHYQSYIKAKRETLIRKPLPVEVMTCKVLSDEGINFDYQVIVGRFIVDILIPDKNLVLEIEGMLKWSIEVREKKYRRKNVIEGYGYKVVFVERTKLLKDPSHILNFI